MIDLAALSAALAAHGRVARILVAAHQGSTPRAAGTSMLVWADGEEGTIGGGALEFEALRRARALLAAQAPQARLDRLPLGPALGQCCGGSVTLVTEVFATLPALADGLFARPLPGTGPAAGPEPLALRRLRAGARGEGVRPPRPLLLEGWLVEAAAAPARPLWIWGAGHVGRALAAVLAPLPDLALTWVDTAPDRFPERIPPGVRALPAPDPCAAVPLAPQAAEHLILTFSHALDLALCDALLRHGFAGCGLIGSATKRARFRTRLAALGHPPARIDRIACPIGDPALGKHPQTIAIGVAAHLLAPRRAAAPPLQEMPA
jgi:xanthine dehydrogenase accessory factor